MTPKVSVLVAVYNQARFIRAALDSLARSIESDFELVVVDDASTDGSGQCASQWLCEHAEVPGRLLQHETNRGTSATRNTALAAARAPFCFVHDADDLVYPHCLQRLREALARAPTADFAYGMVERFDDSGPLYLLSTQPWSIQRLRRAPYICSHAMFRTESLRGAGGFTTDAAFAAGWEDYELWCRLANAGRAGMFVPEILSRYRLTEPSRSSGASLQAEDLKAALSARYPRIFSEPS